MATDLRCPQCGFLTPRAMFPDGHPACMRCGRPFSTEAGDGGPGLPDAAPSLGGAPPAAVPADLPLASGPPQPAAPRPHAPPATAPASRERPARSRPEARPADPGAGAVAALQAVLLVLLAWWGWRYYRLNQPYGVWAPHFLHQPLLVFHEAGHLIFAPFGRLMGIAGGSLMQLLVPLTAAVALLLRRDRFGAAVGVWWLGTSFVDLAPYIGDAQSLKLMMIGGFIAEDVPDAHDWRNLLYAFDLLHRDREIAAFAHGLGGLLMAAGLAWAAWAVCRRLRGAPEGA